jgi:hypothetical protein
MRFRGWQSAWTLGPTRIAVVLLVALATSAVVVKYPAVLGDAGDEASRKSSQSYADREIAGGNSVVADQAAVYAARGIIPEDETYRVAVNPDYPGGSDLTVPFVGSYYQYFLMPRRPAEDAPWIICYACDLDEYGPGSRVVWKGDEDISIVRVG